MSTNRGTPTEPDTTTSWSCAHCGQAAPRAPERCAGCGLPALLTADELAAGAVALGGVLLGDVACRQCGYNLRGLRHDGRCPECAAPVAVSCRPDLLCFSAPQYVRSLARGANWLLRGLTTAVLGLFAVLVLLVCGVIDVAQWGVAAELVIWGATIAVLGGILVMLGGIWFFTVADPGAAPGTIAARRTTRTRSFLILFAVGIPASAAVMALPLPLPVTAIAALAMIGFCVCGTLGVRSYFEQVEDVARRLPDAKLTRDAARLRSSATTVLTLLTVLIGIQTVAVWGPAVLATLGLVGTVTPAPPGVVVSPGGLGAVLTGAAGCVMLVVILALIALASRAERLYRALRRPLQQQAALAARFWRARCSP